MTFERLISMCHQARTEFQKAAAAADDKALKRLLNLYAQQRTRFAQELLQELHGDEFSASRYAAGEEPNSPSAGGDAELLQECVRQDSRMLESYRDALRTRIPSRAHFLVSAQYALMQKTHERIQGMLAAATELPPSPRFAVVQTAPQPVF